MPGTVSKRGSVQLDATLYMLSGRGTSVAVASWIRFCLDPNFAVRGRPCCQLASLCQSPEASRAAASQATQRGVFARRRNRWSIESNSNHASVVVTVIVGGGGVKTCPRGYKLGCHTMQDGCCEAFLSRWRTSDEVLVTEYK